MRNYYIYPLMAWVLSSSAWGDQVKPGHYAAKVYSYYVHDNGINWTADVTLVNGLNVVKATRKPSFAHWENFEIWEWDDKKLYIEEWGRLPGGNVGLRNNHFGATNEGNGRYFINCKNRVTGDCEGGIEPARYWMITTTENGFIFECWGIPIGMSGSAIPIYM